MRLVDLLANINEEADVWISTSKKTEDYIYFGEVRFITPLTMETMEKYIVKEIYPEHYPARYSHGITIIVEEN